MTDEPTNEPNLTHAGEEENPTGAIPPIGESSPEQAEEIPQAADSKPATSSVATAKRVATVGGRVVLGLAVAAIAVVGVAAATLAPPYTVTAERTPITAQPAAGNAVLGCSGPLLAIGRNAADAKQVSVAADAQYTASDARAAQGDVAITDVAGGNSVLFSAPPQNDQRVNFAAAGSVSVASADLSGFAAYGCQPAVMQSWLVGAETLTGTTGIVTLSNPGDVTATVTITTFGLAGPVQTPGSQGIVVAPHTTVTVPVAALVAGQEAPVLRIDAHGTPLLANLQSGVVRTLVTGGVDVQSAIAVPSTVQTIPGVQISAAPQSGMTYTRVRLLATEHPTTATVTLQRVGSTAITYSVDVPLDGGIPASIDVPAQDAGTYVVTVKAAEDVVAGVWTTTGYEGGSDFAWAVTAPTLRAGETPLAVPAGAGGSLVIVNTGTDTLQGKVTLAGSPTTVSLAAGQSLSVPAAGGATGTFTITSGEASAAVTFGANQAIATFPVWPADAAAKPVTVSR